jgi:uncharacterized membrane protein YfcA
MELWEAALLLAASVAAGALNAVAGGGTFFTFSALVATGMPAIAANATSSAAVWPGSLAGLAAYREETRAHGRRLAALGAVSLAGGLIGAWALLAIEEDTFAALVPWLLLGATALFAAGPRIKRAASGLGAFGASPLGQGAGLAFQFAVAIYGGFFGAGMGILMLAALTLTERGDFHMANSAKTVLAALINAIAIALFAWGGLIHYAEAALMAVGAIAGGYGGVSAAKRVPEPVLRASVVTVGVVLAAYFFFR